MRPLTLVYVRVRVRVLVCVRARGRGRARVCGAGRGGSRQTRGKVLDHCSQLVQHMLDALERQKQTPPAPAPPDASLLARQGDDLIKWLSVKGLSASSSRAAPPGSAERAGGAPGPDGSLTGRHSSKSPRDIFLAARRTRRLTASFSSDYHAVEVPSSPFGGPFAHSPASAGFGQSQLKRRTPGGDLASFAGGGEAGQAEMGEAMSTGRVTRLALFLHAWQVAQVCSLGRRLCRVFVV